MIDCAFVQHTGAVGVFPRIPDRRAVIGYIKKYLKSNLCVVK